MEEEEDVMLAEWGVSSRSCALEGVGVEVGGVEVGGVEVGGVEVRGVGVGGVVGFNLLCTTGGRFSPFPFSSLPFLPSFSPSLSSHFFSNERNEPTFSKSRISLIDSRSWCGWLEIIIFTFFFLFFSYLIQNEFL